MATSTDDQTQKDLTGENDEISPVLSESPQSSTRTTRSKVTGVSQSCITLNCTSKPSSNPPIHFFNFPKDHKRCLQWVKKVQRQELNDKTTGEISENYALCSEHFEDEMFVNPKQRQRLTPDAVPSIFENTELSAPAKSTVRKRGRKKATNTKAENSTSQKIPAYRCSPLDCHAVRVKPGEELRFALQSYIIRHDLRSAFIMSCVGSVKEAQLRMADSSTIVSLTTPHEILSLNGTLSDGGHLHICLSDADGKVIGGHLLYCIINTTAEVVMGDLPRLEMSREMDESTGYKELVVSDRKGTNGYSSGDDESHISNKRWKRKRAPKSTVKLIDTSNGAPTVLVNNTLLKITDMKS